MCRLALTHTVIGYFLLGITILEHSPATGLVLFLGLVTKSGDVLT